MSTDVLPASQLEQIILDGLATLGPDPSEITPEATLDDLGLDSLDLVELAQVVEEQAGIRLEAQDFKDVRTVGDAMQAIERARG